MTSSLEIIFSKIAFFVERIQFRDQMKARIRLANLKDFLRFCCLLCRHNQQIIGKMVFANIFKNAVCNNAVHGSFGRYHSEN